MELNTVSGADATERYDIREWSPNHSKMGQGITLSEEEFKHLLVAGEAAFRPVQPIVNDPPTVSLWHCADAIGYPSGNHFVVMKGSRVRPISGSFKYDSHIGVRKRLEESGILYRDEFTTDYEFTSCSAAANVVLGRAANGWISWLNENGEPLDILRRK